MARVGSEACVTSLAYPGRVFDGKLDEIGELVDPERRSLELRIVLPDHDAALKPGMSAQARIANVAVAGGATALVVSRHAIRTIDGQPLYSWNTRLGSTRMRPVERGASSTATSRFGVG